MPVDVRIKRAYDPASPDDGYRVLVDHIWPRGVSRKHARLDEWARALAPSDELRHWFDHVPERFPEFGARYRTELAQHSTSTKALEDRAGRGRVTLVYAARDRQHNNAVVLAGLIRESYERS